MIRTLLEKEGTAVAGSSGILLLALLAWLFPRMDIEVRLALATVITTVVTAIARNNTFSVNTIREAGLNPAEVARDAKDDTKPRNTEGET